jgi:hypothetical protein
MGTGNDGNIPGFVICFDLHTCADNRIIIINETHVLLVSPDGIPDLSYISPDMSSPGKPASDFYGNVYIPDLLSHNIYKLLTDSNTMTIFKIINSRN